MNRHDREKDFEAEKKYQKYLQGKKYVDEVLSILKKHTTDEVCKDYAAFEKKIKELIGTVEGQTTSRLEKICLELSEHDRTAVIQKDATGNIKVDPTTKDTEIVKLSQDVDEYFKKEVLPHIPDAIYYYDFDENKKASATNKEKLGAEISFTRYFYHYEAPKGSDKLLKEFMALEHTLSKEALLIFSQKSTTILFILVISYRIFHNTIVMLTI